jgi:hypothetical protein
MSSPSGSCSAPGTKLLVLALAVAALVVLPLGVATLAQHGGSRLQVSCCRDKALAAFNDQTRAWAAANASLARATVVLVATVTGGLAAPAPPAAPLLHAQQAYAVSVFGGTGGIELDSPAGVANFLTLRPFSQASPTYPSFDVAAKGRFRLTPGGGIEVPLFRVRQGERCAGRRRLLAGEAAAAGGAAAGGEGGVASVNSGYLRRRLPGGSTGGGGGGGGRGGRGDRTPKGGNGGGSDGGCEMVKYDIYERLARICVTANASGAPAPVGNVWVGCISGAASAAAEYVGTSSAGEQPLGELVFQVRAESDPVVAAMRANADYLVYDNGGVGMIAAGAVCSLIVCCYCCYAHAYCGARASAAKADARANDATAAPEVGSNQAATAAGHIVNPLRLGGDTTDPRPQRGSSLTDSWPSRPSGSALPPLPLPLPRPSPPLPQQPSAPPAPHGSDSWPPRPSGGALPPLPRPPPTPPQQPLAPPASHGSSRALWLAEPTTAAFALVSSVTPGSPASLGGLRAGDLIVSLFGARNFEAVAEAAAHVAAAGAVEPCEVLREGVPLTLWLAPRRADAAAYTQWAGLLGATLEGTEEGGEEEGVA